jgi:aspartate aminotransferase-like enzyme
MVEKYGVLIGGGYKKTIGKVLRVGHMGYQATLLNVRVTIDALELTLRRIKQSHCFYWTCIYFAR